MAVQGMDVEQVRQMANWLLSMSRDLEENAQRATVLVQQVVGTAWQGPDADQFRSDFDGEVRPVLHRAITLIEEAVQRARHEVWQQESASA